MTVRSVLLVHSAGDRDREYLRSPGEELQCDLGVLTVPEDVTPGTVLETHLGEPFEVREPRGPDLFDHFERTGAPMMPRDVGLIVGHTGVSAGDRVLDAGTGTGVLAAYLGRIGAGVVTYERDPEFADVARRNMRLAGVEDRVDVRTGDLLDALDGPDALEDLAVAGADEAGPERTGQTETAGEGESTPGSETAPERAHDAPRRGFDLLTLDTGDAAAIVERAPELLVAGGFVAVYSPFVEQTRAAALAAREAGLDPTTYETIQREMDFGSRGSRPSTAGVGHTGYLTFARN